MAPERAKMPVVNISSSRFERFMPGVPGSKILEMLPFAGLDIEGVDDGTVRVEYNPNRPDFSSDYGIFRALRGIMGLELGPPKIKLGRSNLTVVVDSQTKKLRPFIVALTAKGGNLQDQTIKQLIAMQEDLHDGIGRRRKKASIGLHNMDVIRSPLKYTIADPDYSFVPLGDSSPKTISEILGETPAGKRYGNIFENYGKFPIIIDKSGNVLSFPPIINGAMTKVDENTRNLFVEVTGTSGKAVDDVLAIIAMTLADAGFTISSVAIQNGGGKFMTPRMHSAFVKADLLYINSTLGLHLNRKQVIKCLQKCRLGATVRGSEVRCEIPRYRTDISGAVDVAEEVAIGYGIFNFEPTLPPTDFAGSTSTLSGYFGAIRETLIGLGMIESLSFSLVSGNIHYESFARTGEPSLRVDGPKSAEHEILRDSLIPSLLHSLSRNVHEEYPQRLFEIGKVFHGGESIRESWAVAAVTAHGDASFTEIKSYIQALLNSGLGKTAETRPAPSAFFILGRSASVLVGGSVVGSIGEIIPIALENFRMRVPVSAFEIDLGALLALPQQRKNNS